MALRAVLADFGGGSGEPLLNKFILNRINFFELIAPAEGREELRA